jgi:ankyrin repeat protein
VNVNAVDESSGETALTAAALDGRTGIVEVLCAIPRLGLMKTNFEGDSALCIAANKDHVEVASVLLGAGATPNARNMVGDTALVLACKRGKTSIVELLLRQKEIDPDLLDWGGFTPLHTAADNGHEKIVQCLLDAGANPRRTTSVEQGKRTALNFASARGHDKVVAVLLAWGNIDTNHIGLAGNSALHDAAENGSLPMAQCLLSAGANVNSQNKSGSTALMIASGKRESKMVQLLLDAGADPDLVDKNDRTALARALDNYDVQTCELLIMRVRTIPELTSGQIASWRDKPDYLTLHDLLLFRTAPADPASNALGLLKAGLLDDPVEFIRWLDTQCEMLLLLDESDKSEESEESGKSAKTMGVLKFFGWSNDLEAVLHVTGLRLACVRPVMRCLDARRAGMQFLTTPGQVVNERQRMLYCSMALSRLKLLTAGGKATDSYKAAGISQEGLGCLNAVLERQIRGLVVVAEEAMVSLASDILGELIPACKAQTGMLFAINVDALTNSLVYAGYCPPLANAIATSWQAAMARLQLATVNMPASVSLIQGMQLINDTIALRLPAVFSDEIRKQLDSQELLTQFRSALSEADASDNDVLHLLFQAQCDQLRQYCEQLLDN